MNRLRARGPAASAMPPFAVSLLSRRPSRDSNRSIGLFVVEEIRRPLDGVVRILDHGGRLILRRINEALRPLVTIRVVVGRVPQLRTAVTPEKPAETVATKGPASTEPAVAVGTEPPGTSSWIEPGQRAAGLTAHPTGGASPSRAAIVHARRLGRRRDRRRALGRVPVAWGPLKENGLSGDDVIPNGTSRLRRPAGSLNSGGSAERIGPECRLSRLPGQTPYDG